MLCDSGFLNKFIIISSAIRYYIFITVCFTYRSSRVWNFFKKSTDSKAECTLCHRLYATGGGTSALNDHLERKHHTALQQNHDRPDQSSKIPNYFSAKPVLQKYPRNSPKKKSLDLKLALMIAVDFQPYQIVENQGFREFVEELDPRYDLMCRQTLTNRIVPQVFDLCKQATRGILDTIEYASITSDGWSSVSNDAYISVTIHFIDLDWVFRKMLLDIVPITDISEDADAVKCAIEQVLIDNEVQDKIVRVTTDEGSVMVAATSLLQKKHLPCILHVFNTIIRNSATKKGLTETDDDKHNQFNALIRKNKKIVTFFHRSTKAKRYIQQIESRDLEEGEKPANKFVQMVHTFRFCANFNKHVLITLLISFSFCYWS